MEEKQKQKEEDERKAVASIDWHDFSVVAAIDFGALDMNLPPPVKPDDLGIRLLEMAQAEMEMREQLKRHGIKMQETAVNEQVGGVGNGNTSHL